MGRNKVGFIIAVIIVLTFIYWGTLVLNASDQSNSASPEKTSHSVLTVSTMSPRMMTWNKTLIASGNITPWQEAFVSTEANGVSILHIHADVGDVVLKGQLLAELQHDTLSAELEQVEAELAQAMAQLEEAQADAMRAQKLRQTSALSTQQITQYLIAEKVARTRTKALQARVKSAQIRLAHTRITAPDDGVITERQATLGKVVSPGDILFRLLRQKRLEWHAELPAKELINVRAGQHVTLTLPGASDITGVVRMVAPTVDPHTLNGLVYVDLNTEQVRTGSFATGRIMLGEYQAPGLPLTALTFRDGFAYVFLVDSEGEVQQRQVTPGQRHDGWVAITQGVDLHDRLVESGVEFLSEGDRVRVITPIADSRETVNKSETSPATDEIRREL
jgi:RND family efflux transporter MFP subunit